MLEASICLLRCKLPAREDREEGFLLERIAIPSSVTKLSETSFYGCSSLTAVSFEKESKLKSIGECCFGHSGLKEFVAPESLRTLERDVFCGCWNLGRV